MHNQLNDNETEQVKQTTPQSASGTQGTQQQSKPIVYKTTVSNRLVATILEQIKADIEKKVEEIPGKEERVVTLYVAVKILREAAIKLMEEK